MFQSRVDAVRDHLDTVASDDLEQHVDVLENGDHTVLECVWVVFEEAFWHNRYARRDLEALMPPT